MDKSKAFDFASDSVKQIIALSSGIIALTVTFGQDILSETDGSGAKIMFIIAWSLFGLSTFMGLFGLMAMTGTIDKASDEETTVYSSNIKRPSAIQFVSFFLALIFTIIGSGMELFSYHKKNECENRNITYEIKTEDSLHTYRKVLSLDLPENTDNIGQINTVINDTATKTTITIVFNQ